MKSIRFKEICARGSSHIQPDHLAGSIATLDVFGLSALWEWVCHQGSVNLASEKPPQCTK